jgi:hypothetical protein
MAYTRRYDLYSRITREETMTTTRLRDPATGRFISTAAAARVSVPTASPVVTEPAPTPKKDKKKQGKKQTDKQLAKKKKGTKKAGSSKKKAKKKG